MSELKKPVYVDPRLRRAFERQIHRTIQNPSIWGNQSITRLFLVYGQKGSGMEEALIQLTIDYDVPFQDIEVTMDPKRTAEQFGARFDAPLLIVRKGHLLKFHRELFLASTDLVGHFGRAFGFIIVISEDVPEDDEHVFWRQFKARIPMGLPKKDDYARLLEYHFSAWAASGSPAVGPMRLDYNELALCCDYATPRDVKHFVKRIVAHVIDQYPEVRVELDTDMLRERFMYNSLGTKSLYCITNKDGHALQMRYDPEGQATLDAPTVDQAIEREKKRVKTDSKVYFE